MRPGSARLRALVFALLLSAGSLSALAPSAAAQQQSTLVVRFDHDPPGVACAQDRELGVPFTCAPAFSARPPNYLQAQSVGIVLAISGSAWVEVRCVTGCEGVEASSYWARWTGERQLQFPEHFSEPGRFGTGANAMADKAPRFNGTWEAIAHLSTGTESRQFNVWLMDVYESPEWIARPGATYLVHGRGFDASNVTLRVDHKGLANSSGAWTTVHGPIALRTPTGSLLYRWEVDKAEAARVIECNKVGRAEDCAAYRLVLSGGGKSTETFTFRLAPADLEYVPIETTGTTARQVERTMNLTATYQFYYHGGNLPFGAALRPEHLPESSVTGLRALRVRVENVTSLGETYLVDEVPMVFRPDLFSWRVEWTVPRDLQLPSGGSSRFQLSLADTKDLWGNRVAPMVIGNFTIRAATLVPEVMERFEQLPRADEGTVRLRIAYHNASPFTDAENASQLMGCFVRHTDTATCGQISAVDVEGKHEKDGVWAFTHHYDKGHTPLGAYRFILASSNSHRDKWGNSVAGATPGPFELVPGSPRIEFKTVMRGLDTDVLERGNRVSVQAVVKYGDGTPYNHTIAPNDSYELDVTLVKRAQSGEIVDERRFPMRETDKEAGRYVGSIDLTRDALDTPLGNWTFRFDVRDNFSTPNRNITEIHRSVVAAPIFLEPRTHPPSSTPTGGRVTFRFELRYEDGAPVDPLSLQLEARIFRHDGAAPFGEPISGRLQPSAQNGLYTVEYTVPPSLYAGRYAFVVTGGDRFGNLLAQGAVSKSFTTFALEVPRAVHTQPVETVRRGESAAVIFDGEPGDMSLDTRGGPAIHVERWDAARGEWILERRDARDEAILAGGDHVGVFQVGETTTIGLYRFVLVGRDADYRPVNASSRNFSVLPTEVTRAIVGEMPRSVVKGEGFEIEIERRDGDQVRGIQVLYNGRVLQAQTPATAAHGPVLKLIWNVPFEAPPGNYSFILRGYDLFGNDLVVRTPNVEALATSLEGRILGQPARSVDRGATAKLLFGIAYPTGQFYISPEAPTVRVLDPSGAVAGVADVVRTGLTYEASWSPPPSAPRAEYAFEVTGRGASGNIFPTMRSDAFRVGEGSFTRGIPNDVLPGYERGDRIGFAVAYEPNDEFVEFTLDYFGQVTDASQVEGRVPASSRVLPHRIEPETGRYVVELPTDVRTPVGAYRYTMTGKDGEGNAIDATSRIFLLRTTPIIARWEKSPVQDDFGEAKTLTWTLEVAYRDGRPMTERDGRPSAAILFDNRPTREEFDLRFEDNRWHLSWTTPDVLLPGRYTLTVGGADSAGNTIITSASVPYVFDADLSESFSKVVPGPEPVLLVLALGALAALVGARNRRRA